MADLSSPQLSIIFSRHCAKWALMSYFYVFYSLASYFRRIYIFKVSLSLNCLIFNIGCICLKWLQKLFLTLGCSQHGKTTKISHQVSKDLYETEKCTFQPAFVWLTFWNPQDVLCTWMHFCGSENESAKFCWLSVWSVFSPYLYFRVTRPDYGLLSIIIKYKGKHI